MNKSIFDSIVLVIISALILCAVFLLVFYIYHLDTTADSLILDLAGKFAFPVLATFTGGMAVYITQIKDAVSAISNSTYSDKADEAYHKGDYYDALLIWEALAKKGDVKAQYNLGVMYRDGKGGIKSDRKAMKWWKKASAQGYAQAQFNLAVLYDEGKSIRQNYKKAYKWYRKAAEQGDVEAQYNLGMMYYKAEGDSKSLIKFYMWMRIAMLNGLFVAEKMLENKKDKLTSDEVIKAEKMAKRCIESDYQNCGE